MTRRWVARLAILSAAACGANVAPPDAASAMPDAACEDPGTTGCACAPVAIGASGSVATVDTITKMIGDPERCRIYALAGDHLTVLDTRAKRVIARIELGSVGSDLDLSADSARLVIGRPSANAITEVDPDTLAIMAEHLTVADPYRLEIARDGQVFYVTFDQASAAHRIDLHDDLDVTLAGQVGYQVDVELDDENDVLYAGESGTTGAALTAYGVRKGAFGILDESDLFFAPPRRLLLSPLRGVYYAGVQLELGDLSVIRGTTDEAILVEADDGRLAVGVDRFWDAVQIQAIGAPHPTLAAAAFAASGQELWMAEALGPLQYVATATILPP